MWTIVISSGYFVLPSYAEMIALSEKNAKPKETTAKVNKTTIAQANPINQVQLIGNTVLTPDQF